MVRLKDPNAATGGPGQAMMAAYGDRLLHEAHPFSFLVLSSSRGMEPMTGHFPWREFACSWHLYAWGAAKPPLPRRRRYGPYVPSRSET